MQWKASLLKVSNFSPLSEDYFSQKFKLGVEQVLLQTALLATHPNLKL